LYVSRFAAHYGKQPPVFIVIQFNAFSLRYIGILTSGQITSDVNINLAFVFISGEREPNSHHRCKKTFQQKILKT